MKLKALFVSLLLQTSCSILFPRIAPDKCTQEGPIRCDGDILVSCREGFIAEEDCAPASCVATADSFVCEEAVCGNGNIESSEDCEGTDLGQQNCQSLGFAGGSLACLATCAFDTTNCINSICGDTLITGAETCDDGNQSNGDGCSSTCDTEICGDNTTNNDGVEECDGADLTGEDCLSLGFDGGALGCNASCFFDLSGCTTVSCGNGVIDGTDECDDGNNTDGDGCSGTCITEFCGDGATNTDATSGALDECDDGNTTNGDGCTAQCKLEFCGDGADNNGFLEQCDDGNQTNGDGCDNNCSISVCGNGIPAGAEVCDDGNTTNGDGCDNNCTATGCPNGITTAGEACDDGNLIDNDGCTNACQQPNCGNNIVESGFGEQCDDGNATNGDGCDNNCTFPACGNGITTGAEQCDDGNQTNGDGCTNTCVNEVCGDGVDNNGNLEQCDDGNAINGDACDSNCTFPTCGNGIKTGTEQCDDGNNTNNDGCSNICVIEGCGDSVVQTGIGEQCDDGIGGALQIVSLTPNGCQAIEHDNITGDDRGGIAISKNRVFYNGDNALGAFDLTFLTGTNTNQFFDALTSDLSTGKVFSLGNGGNPLGQGGTVTSLIELDPITGAPSTNVIPISQPINVFGGTGIFAGPGRVVLHDGGHVFEINTLNGQVTDRGPMPFLPHQGCENWAYWGVAEFFGNELFLTAIDAGSIVRHRVSDNQTTTLATFNLSDACAFTVSPSLNRWYFHHEGTSQFNSADETIGYCNATFSLQGGAPLPGDGCSDTCQIEVCGDGVDNNNGAEECDDGNAINGDGCENDCSLTCGSGVSAAQRVLDQETGHCYLGIDNPTDWFTARDNCAAIGGHLATIHNFRENALLFSMDPTEARWLGLNDLEPTDGIGEAEAEAFAFAYESGEINDFVNFFADEPNDFQNIEDCVHFFGNNFFNGAIDTWNDLGCDELLSYICEIDTPACGNGAIEGTEQCDDGNTIDNDGCKNDCTRACGDGQLQGAITPNVRSVTFVYLVDDCSVPTTRTFSINGVSVVAPPTQTRFCTCEPGIENFTVTDPTLLAAITPTNNIFSVSIADPNSFLGWAVAVFETSAGNGFIEQVIFDQSGGNDAQSRNPNICGSDNVEGPVTRNSFPFSLSFAEACDDGNLNTNDACRNDCQPNVCGDGITNFVTEQCDDGDSSENNLCHNNCTFNFCGDNVIDFTEEDCDGTSFAADCTDFGFDFGTLACGAPSTANECQVITSGCAFAVCGNGVLENPEFCDDGNTVNNDGCDSNCFLEPRSETEPNEDGSPSIGAPFTPGNDFDAVAVQNATNNGAFSQDTMISAAINPAGDEDVFAITNPIASAVTLHLETFTNSIGTACGVDTVILVRDAAGTILDGDDDSGIPFCDRLDFPLAANQTVFVQVFQFDDNTAIDPYFLWVDFR